MMRTILLVIALLIVIVMALVWTGVINLNRNANGSVSIETKDVQVGTTPANVQVPVVRTETRQVEVPSVAVTNGSNAQ
jgi:preprotein translocase subunit SecF